MEALVFFSMIAGILTLLSLLAFAAFIMIVKELFDKRYQDVAKKDAIIALCLSIVLGFMTWGIIWTTVDSQKAQVQCELKGGIVNESQDCVLEIPL